MEFGIASVAGITVICYLAAQAVKATNLDNKWLPVICGVLGGILGVVGLYWISRTFLYIIKKETFWRKRK